MGQLDYQRPKKEYTVEPPGTGVDVELPPGQPSLI